MRGAIPQISLGVTSVPRVSVIIRTKNEERWIRHCLKAVYGQTFRDFEVILVDNRSTDATRDRAAQFPVRLVDLDVYRPGLALNRGIEASSGEIIVCLSGHCVPADDSWLEHLIAGLEDPAIAGVYGRQKPMSFTSPQDKRDLMITFGLDCRLQINDSFFHNANSAIRRTLWEQVAFDPEVHNIEDRIWAAAMLEQGHQILYEPSAAVFHHHGIHHSGDSARTRSTVDVLERLQRSGKLESPGEFSLRDHDILGLVPFEGERPTKRDEQLLRSAIRELCDCPAVGRTVVLTESPEAARLAQACGAEVPVLRSREHRSDTMDLGSLYGFYLKILEDAGVQADLVVSVEPTYKERPPGLLTELIEHLVRGGYDSVLPVICEYNYAWMMGDHGQSRIDSGDLPRPVKDPLLISVKGLGLVTRPDLIRRGRLVGDRVGLVQIAREWLLRGDCGDIPPNTPTPVESTHRGRRQNQTVAVSARGPLFV